MEKQVNNTVARIRVITQGLITEKIPYEILKSWDSLKISGFPERFQERF